MKQFVEVIKKKKPVIAMIHLYGDTLEEVYNTAVEEIELAYNNGIDAVLVENYASYSGPMETSVMYMKAVLGYLQKNHLEKQYGVNFLYEFDNPKVELVRQRGSVFAEEISYELANKYGASFVQAESAAGHVLPEYDERFNAGINALRKQYPDITLIAGVRFKYQPELSERTVAEDVLVGAKRCDAIVVTGEGTGVETKMEKLFEFKEVYPEGLYIIGSGLDTHNAGIQFREANGGIVGTSLKKDKITENKIDEENVKAFVYAAKGIVV